MKGILGELNDPISFRKRKSAIPAEMRPIWKLSMIVYVLKNFGRAGKMSENKLHFFLSIIRDQGKWNALRKLVKEEEIPYDLTVRYDPSVNRALLLAKAEKLVEYKAGGSVALTETGQEFVELILQSEDVFSLEKGFLGAFKKSDFSESFVKSILNMGYASELKR